MTVDIKQRKYLVDKVKRKSEESAYPNIKRICRSLGISYQSYYNWKKELNK